MSSKDFRGFIRYISTLWGVLGSITVVFPLADILLQRIPLPVDSYGNSTSSVGIPITLLASLFALLYTFVQRDRHTSTSARRSGTFFFLGLIFLVIFFLFSHFEQPVREKLFSSEVVDSTDDYVLLLVGAVPFYVASFACITRAFAMLALIEFQREGEPTSG
jgi:hypothetical protein